MRAVIQRVSEASVTVDGAVIGSVRRGLLVLLGVQAGDSEADAEWLAQKISVLRIFPDDAGQMNRSVIDVLGEALVISQFTLLANTSKGTRPSFHDAAKPDIALSLYEKFTSRLAVALGRSVATGRFAADMKVALINDGPVTLVIDSRHRL